ncbi:MAG: hypothetical protein MI748_20870, partial [Opitutales bacterium]|nr:hypothetical protein [Opitutales bacterium]
LILVDLKSILDGYAADVVLTPGDIVYFPQNAMTDWNQFIEAISPTLSLVSSSLTPFVQVKFLSGN